MSKAKEAGRVMRRKVERQSRKTESKKKPLRSKAISILVFLIGIPGVAAALLTFLPRPSVSVGDPVDPENPFSSAFTVTNGNFVPLRDISVGLKLGNIKVGNVNLASKSPLSNGRSGAIFETEGWEHRDLEMDERFTISPMEVMSRIIPPGMDFNGGEIAIQVQYTPWLVPLKRSKSFGFRAVRQTNSKFYWYAIPLPPEAD
jgi:hypothetical protein